ncbi:NAD(P)-binding domain-containing protein [soil metagenome]
MKIGILGSGIVGRVLASAFLKEGNEVMLGTGNTSKPEVQEWLQKNSEGHIGLFLEAASFADVIVLAISGAAAEEVIGISGIENFKNKTVIDATNPIAATPPVNGVLSFFTTLSDSLMERIQNKIPDAHVVKAFNSVGNHLMYKPDFNGVKPTMFICGNSDEAKKTVTQILNTFGWETEDMGKVESARAIEPLCILWCIPAFTQNHSMHAFKLLKK